MLSRFSHVQLFVTPWTVACQSLLSLGFSRIAISYSRVSSQPGIKHPSLLSPASEDVFFTTGTTWEAHILNEVSLNSNTHKTRLSVDWLTEVLWPEAHTDLMLPFSYEQCCSLCQLSVQDNFIGPDYHKRQEFIVFCQMQFEKISLIHKIRKLYIWCFSSSGHFYIRWAGIETKKYKTFTECLLWF